MTLVRRESVPVSEGQTVIRSHYRYEPPAVAGVAREATTLTKELIVVGCGVNYDANRGVGEPNLVPSQAALSPGGVAGVAFESTASPLEVFLPASADLPLIDDPFTRINIDGTPYMWGLLGTKSTAPGESMWEVVDGGSGHGLVLRGTASGDANHPTEAFRGDREWINDPGEYDYMNYRVQADARLVSNTQPSQAGVCLRIAPDGNAPYGDRFYELHLNAAEAKIQFRYRYYHPGIPGWDWYDPPGWSWTLPNPTQWHTIAVEAVNNSFNCYLDGALLNATPISATYARDGLVGLWVDSDAALFDNVTVLDLR